MQREPEICGMRRNTKVLLSKGNESQENFSVLDCSNTLVSVTESKRIVCVFLSLAQQAMTEYSDEGTGVQREWSCLLPDRNYLQ